MGYAFETCDVQFDFSDSFASYFDRVYSLGRSSNKDRVYFLHLKNPKAKRLLQDLQSMDTKRLPELVSREPYFFKPTFLLHDVEHYYIDSLNQICSICNAPEIGQLVLSIPCIEAIADARIDEPRSYPTPTAYQNEVFFINKKKTLDYFCEHVKQLLLHHLEKKRNQV